MQHFGDIGDSIGCSLNLLSKFRIHGYTCNDDIIEFHSHRDGIGGFIAEWRINKFTLIQENKFLRLFGLTDENY